MKNQNLKNLMESLTYLDLMTLRNDLEKGGMATRTLVESKIRKKEEILNRKCAVCTAPLHKEGTFYTLEFGDKDVRKKMSFCGLDCLEYFTQILKDIQKEEIENERC
ncbi:hypothetical protein GF351_02750 [Candidatus Woesearchaeota archaeon]|nr:hypothetical protein [Candidatus Woesearchaeota archaeon]